MPRTYLRFSARSLTELPLSFREAVLRNGHRLLRLPSLFPLVYP